VHFYGRLLSCAGFARTCRKTRNVSEQLNIDDADVRPKRNNSNLTSNVTIAPTIPTVPGVVEQDTDQEEDTTNDTFGMSWSWLWVVGLLFCSVVVAGFLFVGLRRLRPTRNGRPE